MRTVHRKIVASSPDQNLFEQGVVWKSLFGKVANTMKIEVDEPKDGTSEEFLGCQIAKVAANDQKFLKRSAVIRKHFRVLDASTPVPNCRAAEIFMAVWMARWMWNATLSTDVTMSGTVHEYAAQWGIEPPNEDQLRPWFEFYSDPTPNPKGFPSFIKNPRLQPFAPLALAPNAAPIILHDLWSGRLKISTRLTIRYEDGEDVDWQTFRCILKEDPAAFATVFNRIAATSIGKRVAITI